MSESAKCFTCDTEDPPADQPCDADLGLDHFVGKDHPAGCPGCGRLKETCARTPCRREEPPLPEAVRRAIRAISGGD